MKIKLFLITYTGSLNFRNGLRTCARLRRGLEKSGHLIDIRLIQEQPRKIIPLRPHLRVIHALVATRLALSIPVGLIKKLSFALKESLTFATGILLGDASPWERRRPHYFSFDVMLTGKHVGCWQQIIDSDYDWAMVISDDAKFSNQDLAKTITEISRSLELVVKKDQVFIDLASHYSADFLRKKLSIKLKEVPSYPWLLRGDFFSNTNVSYLISRGLAKNFVNYLALSPLLRLGTIDWLTTFLGRKNPESQYVCFANPPLENGSLEGTADSSILRSAGGDKSR